MIIQDDVIHWAKNYGGDPFMAMLLDPPYHLTSITKRFGKNGSAPAKFGKDGAFSRASAGFMGQQWDGGDLAFRPETWAVLAQHLYPGAFIMAFASSRGWHRMAVAMEDAGLILHPSLFMFGWCYLSGFPKATRIDTQLDRQAGESNNREVVYKPIAYPDSNTWGIPNKNSTTAPGKGSVYGKYEETTGFGMKKDTLPVTPLAQAWAGHRYGGQMIKPSIEPLVIASKHLNYEPIYAIISQNTFIAEVICSLLNAPDAENLMNHLHQTLKAVVVDSVQNNVETWELLKSVKFVGLNLESSLATLNMQSFVAEYVPTKVGMLHLVKTILIGQEEDSLVRDMYISESEENILQNIAMLWSNTLTELLNRGSMFIISMATNLITDLKILNSYLCQIILDIIIKGDKNGWMLHAQTVEILLRSVLIKLQSLINITATGNVTETLAEMENAQEERKSPAIEPIIVAQVPYQGRPVENIIETGAGALWIDGGRIPINDSLPSYTKPGVPGNGVTYQLGETPMGNHPDSVRHNVNGRWPSNLILHCSCDPTRPDKSIHDESCAVFVLDGQSGELKSGGTGNDNDRGLGIWGNANRKVNNPMDSDSGPASRMFYQSSWDYEVAEQLAAADSIRYEPKASSNEREIGLDDLESKPLTEQDKWAVNDRRSGTDRQPTEWVKNSVKNIHPTVKPISLTKYLAQLLLPPAQYAPRRILIPFCGVASEYIGAMLAGWEKIVGIEREANYVEIARERVKWWSQWPGWGQADVDKILASNEGEQQLRMF